MMPDQFTAEEKAEAAAREVAFRERVYPKWVQSRRLKQGFADRQIALMREIEADYRALAEKERLL